MVGGERRLFYKVRWAGLDEDDVVATEGPDALVVWDVDMNPGPMVDAYWASRPEETLDREVSQVPARQGSLLSEVTRELSSVPGPPLTPLLPPPVPQVPPLRVCTPGGEGGVPQPRTTEPRPQESGDADDPVWAFLLERRPELGCELCGGLMNGNEGGHDSSMCPGREASGAQLMHMALAKAAAAELDALRAHALLELVVRSARGVVQYPL